MNRVYRKSMAAIALAAGLAWANSAAAQVLQMVPTDSMVVLKVNHLKATSDKIGKLSADLGIAAFVPDLTDPLGALEAKLGVKQGVDPDGELAIVFLDPATVGNDPQKAMLALLPVTDYKAFIGNFANAKTEGGISEVDLPEHHYIANWGKYAALSPSKEAVATKPAAGVKFPAMTSKEIDAKDAVLISNFTAIRGKLLPELQQHRDEIISSVEDALKNNPQTAKYTPVFKAVVNQGLSVAQEFLTDADASTLGINIAPEGINYTLMADFKPETYIGKFVSKLKNTDKPLVEGLPDGKYLVYGGMVCTPDVGKQVFSDLADPIAKEVAAAGPDMKGVSDYIDLIKTYIGIQTGQNFGLIVPTGAIGVEPLIQFFSVQTGDAKAMTETFTKMTDAQAEFMKGLNMPGAVAPVHTANAKTIDGVSFDSLVTKVDMNAQDPMVAQQAQIMAMMYGPAGAVVNYGVVGDKVLMASGVPDALITTAIEAVKKGDAPLAAPERVKAVAAQLPKQRIGTFYVAVDELVTTGLTYAKQFGAGMNVQLPPDLPPIGTTVSAEGSALRIDAHVPTSLVQSIVAAAMQAQMQMQGGPKGGGL